MIKTQHQAQTRAVIEEYQTKENDTGSSAVQIALLTAEIKKGQGHFTTYPKDLHSRQGLRAKIERRRKLMRYMKDKEPQQYTALIAKLGIRG